MFGWLKEIMQNKAIDILKEKYMNELFAGIGVIKELSFHDKQLKLVVLLDGMDRNIEVIGKDIEIAPDGSSVTVHSFESDMPFLETALNRFATRPFSLPEGKARLGAECARKVLGL